MLARGTVIGEYQIERLIGEGGMAAVYEAVQLPVNRTVALKVMAKRYSDDAGFRARFQRECRVQAALEHANIVTVYAAGESEYGLWLSMPLIKGPTLREIFDREQLSWERILALLAPIADALDYAHRHELIHRDITPQNILVNAEEHPYLVDFGIVKGPGDRSLTRIGQFVGAIEYVAPEQIRNQDVGAAADIYSLATVLYQGLVGVTPFGDKERDEEVLEAQLTERPPRASQARPELPKAIDQVLEKGLAKAPNDRFRSATALISGARTALARSDVKDRGPAVDRRARTRTAAAPAPDLSRRRSRQPRERPAPRRRAEAVAEPGGRSEGGRLGTFGILLAFVLLGVLGLTIGLASAGGDSEPPGNSASVKAGAVGLEAPPGWSMAVSQRISGLPLENSRTIHLARSPGWGAIVVGVSPAEGKTLLPETLRPAANRGPAPVPVALGHLQAIRYRRLRVGNANPALTVFVLPASTGVPTVACEPTGGHRQAFLRHCESVATTLRLRHGSAFPLGPSVPLAQRLKRQLSTLGHRRRQLRGKLAAASKPASQAAFATSLAAAFRSAAHVLGSARVSPQGERDLAAVVRSLRGARDAYKQLATTARDEDVSGYSEAAARVRKAERSVNTNLHALRDLGYRVGS